MNSEKVFCMALAAVLLVMTGGCGRDTQEFISSFPTEGEAAQRIDLPEYEMESGAPAAEGESEASRIYVYVCGAVAAPGVYPLQEGARAFEAVEAAGGFTEEAESRAVNLARVLTDGEQLTVPTREEQASLAEAGQTGKIKVNINTADSEELMTLNGIGRTRAEAIVAYRKEKGPFTCPEDIMKVSGIKSSLFEKIKDDICVG